MSFFGFDSSLPRDRTHNVQAPGFGSVPDPFAGLSQRNDDEDDEDVLNFEDTYDGLGDQLDETDDAFNADTFGASTVGRDFDFSGQTANARGTLQDQQKSYSTQPPTVRRSPPKPIAKPARSGYEKYSQQSSIPQLEANASIWGMQPHPRGAQAQAPIQAQAQVQARPAQPSQSTAQLPPRPEVRQTQPSQPSLATVTRKMMSLEEVEAAMKAQRSAMSTTPQPPSRPMPSSTAIPSQPQVAQSIPIPHATQILQRPQQQPSPGPVQYQNAMPSAIPANGVPQILQRQQFPASQQQPDITQMQQHLRSIDQNQNRAMPQNFHGRAPLQTIELPQITQMATMHNRGPSYNGRVVTNQPQIVQMSEEERAAFLAEDAKRAKRNHKIHLLSKDNGLMTPQDKNFITRIQLQQLVTATGGLEDDGQEANLAEDFYFQVYSQIRGAPRPGPNQPLNLFAQTYLNQTASRGNRRYPRGGDSHMRRMEQQVQRAVEAAKMKPKNKQLVIEGSLGKISFSNAKTPKPLLNLKRPETADSRPLSAGRNRAPETIVSRKSVLKDIENLYNTLLKMEDHERKMPAPTTEESSGDEIQEQMDWRQKIHELNGILWNELKVLEPIDPSSPVPHPFIAILSHPKGKKLIPRGFRQIDDQQRLTILTMIVVHLEMLDVIGIAYMSSNEFPLPTAIRNEVELFSQAVMPSLFSYANEAKLEIIIGLVGLVTDRVNLGVVVRTKIGLGLLTMFISRAELIKQAGHIEDSDWEQWVDVYNRLFDLIEPHLPTIFTSPLNAGEDMYVWQFLAAVGIGAGPEQQQRLVLGVKERVMDTVMLAKSLPDELAGPRLANVNLFMRAIGLDVELLG